MKKKKQTILEKIRVEDYAAEGKSLARVDGKVIFIEKAIPGDLVDLRVGKNKKDWAEGYPVKFHSYSADRVEPFCSHFGVCGGCQWQMLPYEKQLQYKQRQVEETLKRIGKIALPEIKNIAGAGETRYYRNKLEYTFGTKEYLPADQFHQRNREKEFTAGTTVAVAASSIGNEQEGNRVAGFHAKGLFDKIVDIETCYLQGEPTNAIRQAIKNYGLQHSYSFYDIKAHQGLLRTVQVRTCTTGEVMVNIVFGEKDDEKIKRMLAQVMEQFPALTTLLYTVNTKYNDSLHDLEPVVFHGNGYVTEKLEDFQFRIGPLSFFQTNTRQAEKLYSIARDFATLTGTETVYDLYCGTGSIGLFVSRKAKKIIGVEMIAEAIDDARINARINSIHHAEFFSGDVTTICTDDFFEAHGRPDVIITDPPRAGMHEKLVKKILDIAAPVLVYVSCNPSTQARDLNLLDEKYAVTAVQPVDMFPHTHHIENVVRLQLRS